LEHVYSQDVIAGKVFYLLLQIAHLLFQLTEKGSLFRKAFPAGVGSLRHLARRLLEAWRNLRLNPAELQELLACRVRICFNTSWPFCPSLIAVLSVLPRPVETPAVPPHCMTSLSVGRPSHALRAKALARAWPHSSRPVPALRRILQR
jgi:hypothetical protein